MSVSQRLDLRQSQSLVMTPQLQQAIKLLQMSHQDIAAFVANEIENNPLLERPDDAAPLGEISLLVPTESKGGAEDSPRGLAGTQTEPPTQAEKQPQTDPWDADAGNDDRYGQGSSSASGSDEQYDALANVAAGRTLRDHILEQIHLDFTAPAERMVAAALVDLLDDAGYLPENLDLARAQLGLSAEALESIILRLHRVDPPGLFARSLKECLAIQLRDKNRLDPAMEALLDHLPLLANREHTALMKLCGVDAEDLADMIAEIRALTPKPALAFGGDIAPPVAPDVLLHPLPGGGWQVELNSETLPRVLANETYFAEIQAGAQSKTDKSYIAERWQQANWLVKALHQRATTILKVASEIVKRQDSFFVHGIQFLTPLTLRDVAEAIEMHESTVSRVTQNKYIATPRGLFELKYFFTNAIATTGGIETVSALAVRTRIKALIDEEKPTEILSDDRLAELLHREGIDIARRTIAKYRESLGIPTSALRKRQKRPPR